MKVYKYTIESVGGIVTEFEVKDLSNSIEIVADAPMITINNPAGRIFLPVCNVVRIIEKEVEI